MTTVNEGKIDEEFIRSLKSFPDFSISVDEPGFIQCYVGQVQVTLNNSHATINVCYEGDVVDRRQVIAILNAIGKVRRE